MSSLKRFLCALIACVMLVAALAAVPALAEGEDDTAAVTDEVADDSPDATAAAPGEATDVAAEVRHASYSEIDWAALTDGDDATHAEIAIGTVTITSEQPIAGVYLKFHSKPSAWIVKAGDVESEHGQDGFLHEYVEIEPSTGIELVFPRAADLSGLGLYTEGTLPASVQVWDKPVEDGADLMLLATQAGDEHTYMGGVLPLAIDAGARCQVVYFCGHDDDPIRMHETLDGLWAIGMKNYPVFGVFPLLAADSLEELKAKYGEQGFDEDAFIDRQVENIRRFCPQVLMIPDAAGEGGELASAINSVTAQKAVVLAADDTVYPMSLTTYGTWDTPKTYVHLGEDGAITLDLDAPLAAYGGRSAYEMACVGFERHESIHWTTRYEWLFGVDQVTVKKDPDAPRYAKATEIEEYNPAKWGLWRSTVGADGAQKADLFDNVTLYDVQAAQPEPEQTEPVTSEPETTSSPNEGVLLPDANKNGGDKKNGGNNLMIIVVICGVMVVAGTAFALILSAVKARSAEKKQQRAHDKKHARSEENARRVREARLVRARIDGEGSKPDADDGEDGGDASDAARTTSESTRDPSGKGAEREAAIKAARAARDMGASEHDKPTDKHY